MISVIAVPDTTERMAGILFEETTTLGIRVIEAQRRVLARSTAQVDTPFGLVGVKYTENGSFAPEYEDCRKVAGEKGVALRTVIAEANDAFRRKTLPR